MREPTDAEKLVGMTMPPNPYLPSDGMRSVDPRENKSLADWRGTESVPVPPTRTLVRLTGFRNGSVVLVDPLAVIAVSHRDGTEPRTVITLRDKNGTIPVRETPAEVNNLLARAGVRIIGADDVSYDAFMTAFGETATPRCPQCHRKLDKCACGDICEGCGNYRDECSDKGICPDVPPPPPAPAPGEGPR